MARVGALAVAVLDGVGVLVVLLSGEPVEVAQAANSKNGQQQSKRASACWRLPLAVDVAMDLRDVMAPLFVITCWYSASAVSSMA